MQLNNNSNVTNSLCDIRIFPSEEVVESILKGHELHLNFERVSNDELVDDGNEEEEEEKAAKLSELSLFAEINSVLRNKVHLPSFVRKEGAKFTREGMSPQIHRRIVYFLKMVQTHLAFNLPTYPELFKVDLVPVIVDDVGNILITASLPVDMRSVRLYSRIEDWVFKEGHKMECVKNEERLSSLILSLQRQAISRRFTNWPFTVICVLRRRQYLIGLHF